ncbi:outer membrane protein assembly factor BamB family protein [Microbulbifer sp.]|uniref:outer membrane protein assembly factor BamB family protein n=1 Tax=Microbulbifer sp. TaxID=1908541 RepID=UPI003F3B915C
MKLLDGIRGASVLVLGLVLVACGGSGGGSDDGGDETIPLPDDVTPPTAEIHFPHLDGLWAVTYPLVVRGTAYDDRGIRSVRVNGVSATSEDNFHTWQATVSLTEGIEALTVEVEDTSGNITQDADTRMINRYSGKSGLLSLPVCGNMAVDYGGRKAFIAAVDLVEADLDSGRMVFHDVGAKSWMALGFDSWNSRLYGVDVDGDLYEIDLSNNEAKLISQEGTDEVYFQDGFISMVFDDLSGRVYVYSRSEEGAVYTVDLKSGSRFIVSGMGVGSGPQLNEFSSIKMSKGEIYAVFNEDKLLKIDPSSGDRTKIFDASNSEGSEITWIMGLVLDAAGEHAYLADIEDKIIKVDLTSGFQEVVSSAEQSLESNLVFRDHFDMSIDPAGDTLYLDSCEANRLLAVDLNDGQRSKLTRDYRGQGPVVNYFGSMRYDSENERIVLVNNFGESYAPGIMAVNSNSGDREILLKKITDATPALSGTIDFVIGSESGRIFATDGMNGRLVELDFSGKEAVEVSSADVGLGPKLEWPTGIEIDESKEALYVLDVGLEALFVVDIATGNRTVLSQVGVSGSGDNWDSPQGIALGVSKSEAYISDMQQNAIYQVDLVTGKRAIFSGDTVGEGPSLAGPMEIRLDPVRNKLIVANTNGSSGRPGMVFVDLETGDRENRVSSGVSIGDGGIVDPKTGYIYLGRSPGQLIVYDYETAQALTISQ